jgi:hypothetical protein
MTQRVHVCNLKVSFEKKIVDFFLICPSSKKSIQFFQKFCQITKKIPNFFTFFCQFQKSIYHVGCTQDNSGSLCTWKGHSVLKPSLEILHFLCPCTRNHSRSPYNHICNLKRIFENFVTERASLDLKHFWPLPCTHSVFQSGVYPRTFSKNFNHFFFEMPMKKTVCIFL